MKTAQSLVAGRQAPLRAAYAARPETAIIYKRVRTQHRLSADALHGAVVPGEYGVAWSYGIDHAVGGMHDAPNPGEILCASLAACQDSTIRMIADIFGIGLKDVTVEVIGKLDVRGSLMVDRTAPIGFASLECRIDLEAAPGTPPEALSRLLQQSERSCINLATLRSGVPVQTVVHDRTERDCNAPASSQDAGRPSPHRTSEAFGAESEG